MVISVRFPAELDHSIHGPEEELCQNSLLKRTWRNGILPECFLLQYVRNLRILLWCKTAKLSNRIFSYFTLFPQPPTPPPLPTPRYSSCFNSPNTIIQHFYQTKTPHFLLVGFCLFLWWQKNHTFPTPPQHYYKISVFIKRKDKINKNI